MRIHSHGQSIMKIHPIILHSLLSAALCASATAAQETEKNEKTASEKPAPAADTVIYRQITPDGRMVYTDKPPAGKVDHTITVPAPIKGNLWTTEPGVRPVAPPQTKPTPIKKTAAPLPPPRPVFTSPQTYSDTALIEVMRAEMLLEDAKKRQAAGRAPRPSELQEQGGITAPTSAAYRARQQMLARDVAYAEEELKKALAARNEQR